MSDPAELRAWLMAWALEADELAAARLRRAVAGAPERLGEIYATLAELDVWVEALGGASGPVDRVEALLGTLADEAAARAAPRRPSRRWPALALAATLTLGAGLSWWLARGSVGGAVPLTARVESNTTLGAEALRVGAALGPSGTLHLSAPLSPVGRIAVWVDGAERYAAEIPEEAARALADGGSWSLPLGAPGASVRLSPGAVEVTLPARLISPGRRAFELRGGSRRAGPLVIDRKRD